MPACAASITCLRSYMSATAPPTRASSMIGSWIAVWTSATRSARPSTAVISQAAPTDWIALPKLPARVAIHKVRNRRCESGDKVEPGAGIRLLSHNPPLSSLSAAAGSGLASRSNPAGAPARPSRPGTSAPARATRWRRAGPPDDPASVLDHPAVEIALAVEPVAREQLLGPGPQRALEPRPDRDGEAGLGAIEQVRGRVGEEQLPRICLPPRPVPSCRWDPRRHGRDPMIEEGDADLEAVAIAARSTLQKMSSGR